MGRKKKSGGGSTSSAVVTSTGNDDDALLDAAITEVAAVRLGEVKVLSDKDCASANRVLLKAVRDDDFRAMKRAIERGADASLLLSIDEAKGTLWIALLAFDYDLAEMLVKAGFPISLDGQPMLNFFCKRLSSSQLFDKEEDDDEEEEKAEELSNRHTVRFLLEHGADPNLKWKGAAPMFEAISYSNGPDADGEIVRLLLEARVDPNKPLSDSSGEVGSPNTLALCYAAQQGNLRVIMLLLKAGADVNAQTPYEPMDMMAVASWWVASDEEKARQRQRNCETATALFAAGRMTRSSPQHLQVVRLLLRCRAEPDIPLRDGMTPLIDAIVQFDNDSEEGWETGLAHVNLLIDAKARLGVGSDGAYSPLIEAIKKPAARVVEVLLDAGAQIDESLQKAEKCACGCYGDPSHGPPTPLSVASVNGVGGVVEVLIERGVVQANRPSARRALRIARQKGERSIARMIKAELCRCALCGEGAMKRGFACPGCNEAYYCSEDHQMVHFEVMHGGDECAELSAMALLDRNLTSRFQRRAELYDRTRAEAAGHAELECTPCDGEAEADECAVCFEGYEDDDESRTLTCGHRFHASCVQRWLNTMSKLHLEAPEKNGPPSCPYCRSEQPDDT